MPIQTMFDPDAARLTFRRIEEEVRPGLTQVVYVVLWNDGHSPTLEIARTGDVAAAPHLFWLAGGCAAFHGVPLEDEVQLP